MSLRPVYVILSLFFTLVCAAQPARTEIFDACGEPLTSFGPDKAPTPNDVVLDDMLTTHFTENPLVDRVEIEYAMYQIVIPTLDQVEVEMQRFRVQHPTTYATSETYEKFRARHRHYALLLVALKRRLTRLFRVYEH